MLLSVTLLAGGLFGIAYLVYLPRRLEVIRKRIPASDGRRDARYERATRSRTYRSLVAVCRIIFVIAAVAGLIGVIKTV
jgi:hypothetical protein